MNKTRLRDLDRGLRRTIGALTIDAGGLLAGGCDDNGKNRFTKEGAEGVATSGLSVSVPEELLDDTKRRRLLREKLRAALGEDYDAPFPEATEDDLKKRAELWSFALPWLPRPQWHRSADPLANACHPARRQPGGVSISGEDLGQCLILAAGTRSHLAGKSAATRIVRGSTERRFDRSPGIGGAHRTIPKNAVVPSRPPPTTHCHQARRGRRGRLDLEAVSFTGVVSMSKSKRASAARFTF